MSGFEHPNWKLLLRYGRLQTAYSHFAVLVDGVVLEERADLGSQKGPAWMSMKVWAVDAAEAAEVAEAIAPELGFEVRGRVEVYSSEPDRPPSDEPFGYGASFASYAA